VPVRKLYRANLSQKELSLVEPLTVGCHAVARARVAPTDTVAIFGCGGVGLGAVAASAFRGATTIAIDIDDAKLDIAKKAGALLVINSRQQNPAPAIKELTGGFGPQVVIEAVGYPETFRAAVDIVAFTGRVVYIGYAKEPVTYETRFFVQKELDIMGARNALPRRLRDQRGRPSGRGPGDPRRLGHRSSAVHKDPDLRRLMPPRQMALPPMRMTLPEGPPSRNGSVSLPAP
jgi:threonine dehydrogenase-like Zn-dependent dehydrogenase